MDNPFTITSDLQVLPELEETLLSPEAPSQEPVVDILEVGLHALDYRERGLVLSDALLELTLPVIELFSAYVVKGIRSGSGRIARFSGKGTVRTTAVAILEEEMDFLEGSRLLASHLFSAMQGKSSSGGDLAVVRAMDVEAGHLLLALLKLDLTRGFRREVIREGEQEKIRLLPVGDLFPEAERRLQKCAFIPAPPHSFPYDLVVLDNQLGGREGGPGAASFFTGNFLECQLVDGPKEFTKKLPQETEKWMQEEGIPPTVAIQAREAVIQAIHEPEVDLERLADDTFPQAEQRQRFLTHLESSGFEARTFATDQAAADRLSSTLTYVLDGGIRISGDAEAVADLLQVDADPTEEGKVRVVIESFRFERKY